MIEAFGGLLALCVLLVAYPYVIYPLMLLVLPPREISKTGARPSSVTLIFCAFNEGQSLAEKVANISMLKERYPDLEVLAYNDGSVDDTFQQLRARPDLLTVVNGVGRRGKAHGMKQLAARASGDILVFTDANVTLREDSIDNLAAWYQDPNVGGVCGTLRYVNSDASATASVGGAYWRIEEKLKSLESRTGNVMGADGSIFSIRRGLYPNFPDTVLDDLTVSMAVIFAGARLIKADDVVAYERLVAERADEFTRKVRIAARAFHTHLYLRPQLKTLSGVDKFKYRSRKLVRWFGGLFVMLGVTAAVLLAAQFSILTAIATLGLVSVATWGGLRVRRGPVRAVAEIVLALFATLLGVARAVRGQRFVTWSPAKSR